MRKNRSAIHNLAALIDQAESIAEYANLCLAGSHIKAKLEDIEISLRDMNENYIRLKQKFIHDEKTLWTLATDWWAYGDAISEIIHAQEKLEADTMPNAHDIFNQSTHKAYIQKEEIEKRFKKMMQGNADNSTK